MLTLLRTKGNAKWIWTTVWAGLFVVILVFTAINMHSILKGVSVNGTIVSISPDTHIAKISGEVNNAHMVSINGREIFIDKHGVFNESVALPAGFSVITLSARDSLGKTEEKTIEVVSPPDAQNVAFNPTAIINN